MNGKITFSQNESKKTAGTQRRRSSTRAIQGNPTAGSVAATIGQGDDAKNTFIWIAIRWSFIIGGLTSLAIYMRPLYCQAELNGDLLNDIKSAWNIFLPVITLALGYSFGKDK